jgi:phosphinothricin acetyltransferase
MSDLNIVQCTHERHAAAILDIFNDAIVNSTALYDYQPRTTQNMVSWFEAKRAGSFPVIGIEDAQGRLLGFCSWGVFAPTPPISTRSSIRSMSIHSTGAEVWGSN